MKPELIKELLGEQFKHCTKENFDKGFDPIIEIIDSHEFYCTTVYELNTSSKYYEGFDPIRECELISKIMSVLYSYLHNPNLENIFLFKKWFYNKFKTNVKFFETDDFFKYNWSEKISYGLMKAVIDYFENEYFSIRHSINIENNDQIISFFIDVANTPFEAGLFEHIEDDFGIFEDED